MEDYGHWENECGEPLENIGFIYKITNLTNNKKYIGKKLLQFKTIKKPIKNRKNKRHGIKESNWKTYTGSCNQLNNDIEKIGKQNFKFEILCWCKNKSELSYNEMKYIIISNALFDENYYNEYVGGRVRIRKNQGVPIT